MDKFFKDIINYDNEELMECNKWQNEQINRVIDKINNLLDGENKAACVTGLIERLSYIILTMNMDIETQIGYCNQMIRHYVAQHQKKAEIIECEPILTEQKTY